MANAKETQTFRQKIAQLPASTTHVVADSTYDSNALAEQVEWTAQGRHTGRRFLCPENKRGTKQPKKENIKPRDESHRRRQVRRRYYESPRGQRTLLAVTTFRPQAPRLRIRTAPEGFETRFSKRRGQTVEPFHEWFKSLFELDKCVWHRGLENNRTRLLAAMFAYQLLVRYNRRRGNKNGQVRWILDML